MLRKLSPSKTDKITDSLNQICKEMYDKIENMCAVPKGDQGHYSALTANLSRENMTKELKLHRTQLTENMRRAPEVTDADSIVNKYRHFINISLDVNETKIADLDDVTLKRATVVNYIQMNFLYLNLPLQILPDSQWNAIFKEKLSTVPQYV